MISSHIAFTRFPRSFGDALTDMAKPYSSTADVFV